MANLRIHEIRVTPKELRAALTYSPQVGRFTWAKGRRAGLPAGCLLSSGYVSIKFLQQSHYAHRLAWLYVFGEWPPVAIDHIDGDRANNRILNLRLATISQNGGNRRISRNNKSGSKGVCWNKECRKWQASIQTFGKTHHLGIFTRREDAIEAYRQAAVVTFGEFARTE